MQTNLALKLQKLQEMPVVPGTRFTEIVTAFDGFPWAQDTVMAALQLEEVLVMFCSGTWRSRERPCNSGRTEANYPSGRSSAWPCRSCIAAAEHCRVYNQWLPSTSR